VLKGIQASIREQLLMVVDTAGIYIETFLFLVYMTGFGEWIHCSHVCWWHQLNHCFWQLSVSTNEMNCEIETVDDWLKLDKCSLTYSKSEYNGSQYKERIICKFK